MKQRGQQHWQYPQNNEPSLICFDNDVMTTKEIQMDIKREQQKGYTYPVQPSRKGKRSAELTM